jgi:hypothetical protein
MGTIKSVGQTSNKITTKLKIKSQLRPPAHIKMSCSQNGKDWVRPAESSQKCNCSSSSRHDGCPHHYDPLAPFELHRHSDANTRMKKPRALECHRPLFLVPADPTTHNTFIRIFYLTFYRVCLQDVSTGCVYDRFIPQYYENRS